MRPRRICRNNVRTNVRASFRDIPWLRIFTSSVITIFIAVCIFVASVLLTSQLGGDLVLPGFGLLISSLILITCGAINVCIFERIYPQTRLNVSRLWAMVGCFGLTGYLGMSLLNGGFISFPSCTTPFALIAVGIFASGRKYW